MGYLSHNKDVVKYLAKYLEATDKNELTENDMRGFADYLTEQGQMDLVDTAAAEDILRDMLLHGIFKLDTDSGILGYIPDEELYAAIGGTAEEIVILGDI